MHDTVVRLKHDVVIGVKRDAKLLVDILVKESRAVRHLHFFAVNDDIIRLFNRPSFHDKIAIIFDKLNATVINIGDWFVFCHSLKHLNFEIFRFESSKQSFRLIIESCLFITHNPMWVSRCGTLTIGRYQHRQYDSGCQRQHGNLQHDDMK